MPRKPFPLADVLNATGNGAPSPEEKVGILRSFRGQSPEMADEADYYVVNEVCGLRNALRESNDVHRKLDAMIRKVTSPPWISATYAGLVETPGGFGALVVHGQTRRLVNLGDGISPESLATGDEVYLNHELNVLVGRAPSGPPTYGETGIFQRRLESDRLVLLWHGEELVVAAAPCLRDEPLEEGDQLRWDRNAWIAYEKLVREPSRRFMLNSSDDVLRVQIGGQDTILDDLLFECTCCLINPELAESYNESAQKTIFLSGPPGCGKTLMVRYIVAELRRITGKPCHLAAPKPSEWLNEYVGVTERNIRTQFEALHAAARDGFGILFLDEVESIGRARGQSSGRHDDKFLNALLAEIEGFLLRGNVIIISASNRKELIDPALLDRLSDVEIEVKRPDMKSARAIFGVHLGESLPYARTGNAADPRRELIETAVSRIYAPNGDNELCVVRFRDGKTRTVAARELASGRLFRQIARASARAALRREMRGGTPGLRTDDVHEAVSDALERLTTTLTPYSVRSYLSDLPQDVDVVSVEPIKRKVARPFRLLTVA